MGWFFDHAGGAVLPKLRCQHGKHSGLNGGGEVNPGVGCRGVGHTPFCKLKERKARRTRDRDPAEFLVSSVRLGRGCRSFAWYQATEVPHLGRDEPAAQADVEDGQEADTAQDVERGGRDPPDSGKTSASISAQSARLLACRRSFVSSPKETKGVVLAQIKGAAVCFRMVTIWRRFLLCSSAYNARICPCHVRGLMVVSRSLVRPESSCA